MDDKIIVIDRRVGMERDKARVAAYCRVSTEKPGQEESFDTQVHLYQKMIAQNPRWEFAGVYADKGTSAKHRPEFMRLMEDAFICGGGINGISKKAYTVWEITVSWVMTWAKMEN